MLREELRELNLGVDAVSRDVGGSDLVERSADPELLERLSILEVVADAEDAAAEAARGKILHAPQVVRRRIDTEAEIVRRQPLAPGVCVEREQDEERRNTDADSGSTDAHGLRHVDSAGLGTVTRAHQNSFAATTRKSRAMTTISAVTLGTISLRFTVST